MNVYLCSTIRHILFAVTKAYAKPIEHHVLLISCEQQDIKAQHFDLLALPSYISFSFFSRNELKSSVKSTLKGRWIWFLAQQQQQVKPTYQAYIQTEVFNRFFSLNANLETTQLILFNDRNHIARLFRLGFAQYSCIEDGLSSYQSRPLHWYESVWRKLTKHPIKRRYFGDDPRCKRLYFLDINKAPAELNFKSRLIDWINFQQVQQLCYPLFRLSFKSVETMSPYLIVTQPISYHGFVDSRLDLDIYQKMIDSLIEQGHAPSFKIHPRESIDKFKQFQTQGIHILPTNIPVELLLLSQKKMVHLYSINSSAGMGFESFCYRHTLIQEDEVNNFPQIIEKWLETPQEPMQRIEELLSN